MRRHIVGSGLKQTDLLFADPHDACGTLPAASAMASASSVSRTRRLCTYSFKSTLRTAWLRLVVLNSSPSPSGRCIAWREDVRDTPRRVARVLDSEISQGGQRTAVVGRLPGVSAFLSLLLFAHPDREPAEDVTGRDRSPFAGRLDIGRLYGCGMADNLAGCAASVLALERVAREEQRGEIVFETAPAASPPGASPTAIRAAVTAASIRSPGSPASAQRW